MTNHKKSEQNCERRVPPGQIPGGEGNDDNHKWKHRQEMANAVIVAGGHRHGKIDRDWNDEKQYFPAKLFPPKRGAKRRQ